MKSVKPGRGPSFMNMAGSIGAAVFGIIWTFGTLTMGAPFFFPLFGLVFIIIALAQAFFYYKNATGQNRYSSFDITDSWEEPDPLNKKFSGGLNGEPLEHTNAENADSFCPYCGAAVQSGFVFCNRCGKQLPS